MFNGEEVVKNVVGVGDGMGICVVGRWGDVGMWVWGNEMGVVGFGEGCGVDKSDWKWGRGRRR